MINEMKAQAVRSAKVYAFAILVATGLVLIAVAFGIEIVTELPRR